MNALAPFRTTAEASFVETHPGYFTITLGHEQRTITKEGPSCYIAWLGAQDRHWCFAKALKACVEDIEYRLAEAAMAQAAHDEAIASLMRMTPRQKTDLIAKLTVERDMLDWSDAHVDVVARKAVFDRQIATLRAV